MSRILVADDHALIRAGLRKLLNDGPYTHEIGEAATGTQTLELLRKSRWDLLLLDINMPDRSGIDILRQVRLAYPQVRVLMLSAYPERQYAINVIRAGASGYLSKDMASQDMLTAVSTVLAGRRYVSPALAELLIRELNATSDKPLHADLSEREFQIFCKLATGASVSAISNELCLSVKTISTYRSRVLEKMGFKSNADITTYALRNQLTL